MGVMRRERRGAVFLFYFWDKKISRREYERITQYTSHKAYEMDVDGRTLYRFSKIVMGLGIGTLSVGLITWVYAGM